MRLCRFLKGAVGSIELGCFLVGLCFYRRLYNRKFCYCAFLLFSLGLFSPRTLVPIGFIFFRTIFLLGLFSFGLFPITLKKESLLQQTMKMSQGCQIFFLDSMLAFQRIYPEYAPNYDRENVHVPFVQILSKIKPLSAELWL